MVGRSLKASQQGIQLAKQALISKRLKQKDLIGFVCQSRQPISKFFTGKPVDREIFVGICERLGLTWEEIAELSEAGLTPPPRKTLPYSSPPIGENERGREESNSFPSAARKGELGGLSIDIDTLVQQVRQQRHDKIQDQCGTMRMLDISQLIAISDIYTNVNILEEIPSQQWLDASDLARNFNPESDNFERLGLGRIVQRPVAGLDAVSQYDKLMVLGKPGSGKTTFLQWVAIKCDLGDLQGNRVPIFIRLKNFAEDAKTLGVQGFVPLQDYINEEFVSCGITDKSVVETILTQGKALILLDGLDEVLEEDEDEVIKQVRRFVETYFKNKFIITCRIAAQKYRFVREGFSDVEVADFDDKQVKLFAKKWFAVARNNPKAGESIARRFIEELNLPENQQISKLAVTPILLNLTCFVFSAKDEFPSKRSQLYEQGLEILLIKWDEERGVKRDKVYRNLSVEHKIELLSQVAAITFDKNHYFFEQRELQQYIADYLCTLPYEQTDQVTLQQDSKAVLESIAAQHGLLVERAREIYSFSHLTFQEYLTAKWFVYHADWQGLVEHLTEVRWREVFVIAVEMSLNADDLLVLMKQKIDAIILDDKQLYQYLLRCAPNKALKGDVQYNSLVVREYYETWTWLLSFNQNKCFTASQINVLRQYYQANKLLMDCLNSNCEVSPEVRQEIEDTLLLPITEIEKRRKKSEWKNS